MLAYMSMALTLKREQMTRIRNPKAGLVGNILWGMDRAESWLLPWSTQCEHGWKKCLSPEQKWQETARLLMWNVRGD